MKKNYPSSSVARLVEEFEKRHEQSARPPLPSQSPSTTPTQQRPQRPPRARDKEKNITTTQKDTIPSATTAQQRPQRPPRARDKEKNITTTAQESKILYAIPTPRQSPRVGEKVTKAGQEEPLYAIPTPRQSPRAGEKVTKAGHEEPHYATPTPRQSPRAGEKVTKAGHEEPHYATPRQSPRTREPAINILEYELLMQAYQEEIRYLSQLIYGDRLIFEQKMENIQENPNLGEEFLWQITEEPRSISKFSGKKFLCFKTNARKIAEENLSSLSTAVEGYLYTVKYIQENSSHASQTEQRQHEQVTERTQQLTPEEKTVSLSLVEISNRVGKDPSIRYCKAEIQYWSKMVYGNPFIFQDRLEDIQKNPVFGEELLWQLKEHQELFPKFVGHKVLCIKNDARKIAEEAFPTLCNAIENYTESIKQIRDKIVRLHTEEQTFSVQSTEPDKNVQRQQSLSKSAKLLRQTYQEVVGTSSQADNRSADVQTRRAESSKVIAFAN
ncbi:BID domain-containing T4SS effector [Bartonella doshiae]|uniref:BID domain-containing T4SS effector n=1 Tax=Bartonella doshiae TaxID=33044 RepID=UPI001ABB602F|nr:BID domain-containing T4SS effector [Bartonella doshiae]